NGEDRKPEPSERFRVAELLVLIPLRHRKHLLPEVKRFARRFESAAGEKSRAPSEALEIRVILDAANDERLALHALRYVFREYLPAHARNSGKKRRKIVSVVRGEIHRKVSAVLRRERAHFAANHRRVNEVVVTVEMEPDLLVARGVVLEHELRDRALR